MDWNYTKFEYYLITKEESKVEIKFTFGNDLTTYMIIPQKMFKMVLGTWGQCLHDLKATTGMNKKIGSKKENNESEHFGFDTEIP